MSVTFQEFFDGINSLVLNETSEITDEFLELAKELIDDFVPSNNAIWVRVSEGIASDSNKPWDITEGSQIQVPIKMVFYPIENKYNTKEIIEADLRGIMYYSGFNPDLNDIVLKGDNKYKPLMINDFAPIDGSIIYIVDFKA